MLHAIDRLTPYLLDLGLSASALFFLIILAMVLCRQPTRRRVWARSGLISSLLLPVLVSLNPGPRLDVSVALRPLIRPSIVASAPAMLPWPSSGSTMLLWLGRGAGIGYLVGSAGFLGWWLLGRWGVRFVVNHSVPPSDETADGFDAIPSRGVLPRPRLRVSTRVGRPVLAGFWRTTILIPPTLDRPEARAGLLLSLEHELAHARSADPFFLWIGGLAQALWFGIPPFWWIREQVRLDQEFLADREALGDRGVHAYASSLVEMAKAGVVGDEPGGLDLRRGGGDVGPPSADARSPLFQRILMLIKNPYPIEQAPPPGLVWSAGLATLALTCSASFLTLGFRDDAASWPNRAAVALAPFHMRRLDLPASGPSAEPFRLRYRLGEAFTLDAEVFATGVELQQLRIQEHALGSLQRLPDVLFDEPAWHPIRIVRSNSKESVWVDGIKIADRIPVRDRTSWISLQALPDRPTEFREILVRPVQATVDPLDDPEPVPTLPRMPN